MQDKLGRVAESAAKLERTEREWREEIRQQLLQAGLPAEEILSPSPKG